MPLMMRSLASRLGAPRRSPSKKASDITGNVRKLGLQLLTILFQKPAPGTSFLTE